MKVHGVMMQALQSAFDVELAQKTLKRYDLVLNEFHASRFKACCNELGMFSEQMYINLYFLSTGKRLVEVKSKESIIKSFEKDATIPESVRFLVPRVLNALAFDIRSKKGAVHLKGVEPTEMDANLGIYAMSWSMSEILRNFSNATDEVVSSTISELMRSQLPYVENISGEIIVTANVSSALELLLLLSQAWLTGLTRFELGKRSKFNASTVSNSLNALNRQKFVHKSSGKLIFITGQGERYLIENLPPH